MSQRRFKIILEYIGTGFSGWQKLKYNVKKLPVQQVLEDALEKIHSCKIKVTGSSRTDTGVSSTCQTAHFDLTYRYDKHGNPKDLLSCEELTRGMNYNFANYPMRVISIEEVPIKFHSRYQAKSRTYLYKILSGANYLKSQPLQLLDRVWPVNGSLDISLMKEAADTVFTGVHDYNSFRSSSCTSVNPIRSVSYIKVFEMPKPVDYLYNSDLLKKDTQKLIGIEINARSFLHNQVRIMVSSLVEVGLNNITIPELLAIRDRKDRQLNPVPTAPPEPLTLVNVEY